MTKVGGPEEPLCAASIDCRKQANRISGHFIRMVLTEGGNSFESCCLKSVHKAISNHLNLNRRPSQSRMLRNGQSGTTLLNSIIRKLSSLVPGWFWVVENMKRISQNPRKALPVQAISMSISIIIPEDTRKVCHLNPKRFKCELYNYLKASQIMLLRRLRKNVILIQKIRWFHKI